MGRVLGCVGSLGLISGMTVMKKPAAPQSPHGGKNGNVPSSRTVTVPDGYTAIMVRDDYATQVRDYYTTISEEEYHSSSREEGSEGTKWKWFDSFPDGHWESTPPRYETVNGEQIPYRPRYEDVQHLGGHSGRKGKESGLPYIPELGYLLTKVWNPKANHWDSIG